MIEVTKLAIPFANSGNKAVIYDTRQDGQKENEATWEGGFPPITMIRKEDGGLPPTGLDFNGIFHDLSSNVVFSCMGGQYKFDAEYANKIKGYPKGAILLNDDESKQYISNIDSNKVNFNTAKPEELTAWSVISIADIDKLLAGKIDNQDFTEALNQKANANTNIVAGNGLTGGGTLATSRTLSLGSPSTITESTTNNVTTSSHTHEITKATTSQAGIVQLTNIIDSSIDKAITPFAVSEIYKAIIEAIEVPVSQIFAFESATPPKGYIARNGQAIDKATMPKLYARYGEKMPDDRDRVLRMAGSLAGTAGSTQEDAIQTFSGFVSDIYTGFGVNTGGVLQYKKGVQMGLSTTKDMQTGVLSINLSSGGVRTSTETRVKGRIVIFCNKIQ